MCVSRQRDPIVEDDDDVRTLLASRFEHEGFTVCTAADGAQAITELEAKPPPLAIVTDLHMPGIAGHELIEYVTASRRLRDVPVAVVSAQPHLAPEGVRVFCKPARFEPLLRFVRDSRRSS